MEEKITTITVFLSLPDPLSISSWLAPNPRPYRFCCTKNRHYWNFICILSVFRESLALMCEMYFIVNALTLEELNLIHSLLISGEGPHLATSREPAWRGAGGAQGEKEAATGRGGRGQAKWEEHLSWRRGKGANAAGSGEGKEGMGNSQGIAGTGRIWLTLIK